MYCSLQCSRFHQNPSSVQFRISNARVGLHSCSKEAQRNRMVSQRYTQQWLYRYFGYRKKVSGKRFTAISHLLLTPLQRNGNKPSIRYFRIHGRNGLKSQVISTTSHSPLSLPKHDIKANISNANLKPTAQTQIRSTVSDLLRPVIIFSLHGSECDLQLLGSKESHCGTHQPCFRK